MKKDLLIRYALLCIVLLLSAGWSFWSLEHRLWMSLAVSVLVFISGAVLTWHIMLSPLRTLHKYILDQHEPGKKASPKAFAYSGIYETERAVDKLVEKCREQMYHETGRQQFYELVLRQVETGVVACTPDGRVEWMNRSAEEQIGILKNVDKEWLDENAEAERVVHFVRHNHYRDILLARLPFRECGNDKFLFTLRDVRHVLEAKQQESWKSLSRVLTHEIMNSMTPILSLAETLARHTEGKETTDRIQNLCQGLEVIRRRGKGLMEFVDNYRTLTRVPPPQIADINADEFFVYLRRLFPETFMDFEQPYRNFSFRADRAQLEQVIINLVRNAVEAATQKGSPVSISLSRSVEHREVYISIQDHGQGIATAELEHIFMPFYTTKKDGNGIGLSLCKQIINNHGGDILVHSVQDHGSCFTICLPY